ncbi:DUF421 domain-containing protein [Aquibacillus halophilus]|uniref:DUF421 domain-containing protein n=1 Tax=Aquibacillus halophilus TaxID=930132 RepID=A0A6A8DTA9_9BACI|nr:DUF421 domain-containing protein [Aquibacillus halophilus]MRH44442.1 DUF421 domain-containing protein [Aquibacillus halophilus]
MLEYFFNPLLLFVVGFIVIRISGKKAVAEMTPLDLLFVGLISNLLSEPLIQDKPLKSSYYGVLITAFYLGMSYLSLNKKIHRFIIPGPTVLIRNGDIDEKGLQKMKMTTETLLGDLRTKGYTNPKDIDFAALESNGKLSVIPKSSKRPLEATDINLTPRPEFIPIPLVMDGKIIKENLDFLKKDINWLVQQLNSYGKEKSDIPELTLAYLNQSGFVEIDEHNFPSQNPSNYMPD